MNPGLAMQPSLLEAPLADGRMTAMTNKAKHGNHELAESGFGDSDRGERGGCGSGDSSVEALLQAGLDDNMRTRRKPEHKFLAYEKQLMVVQHTYIGTELA